MTKAPPDLRLASSELRQLIVGVVRRRVPPSEVDDIVQTVFCEALASQAVPEDEVALRKWLVGIAKHKVADLHRKGGRRQTVELDENVATETEALSARDLARWADEQLGDNVETKRTFEWMAREGDGEKLAHIAEEAALPPEQVRQRVSRLRRFMRERWARELAAVAGVVAAMYALWWLGRDEEKVATPLPSQSADRPAPQLPAGGVSASTTAVTTPSVAPEPSATVAPSATLSPIPTATPKRQPPPKPKPADRPSLKNVEPKAAPNGLPELGKKGMQKAAPAMKQRYDNGSPAP